MLLRSIWESATLLCINNLSNFVLCPGDQKKIECQKYCNIFELEKFYYLLRTLTFKYDFHKQSFADNLQNRCFQKFCKFHRKTLALESFLIKIAGLQAFTPFFTEHLKKRLYGPFLWIGFNCIKATEPLRGYSLL